MLIVYCYFKVSIKIVAPKRLKLIKNGSTNFTGNTVLSKTVPYFWWLCLNLSYNTSKNPLRGFIGVQINIEFHLPHYEISQLSSRYWAVSAIKFHMEMQCKGKNCKSQSTSPPPSLQTLIFCFSWRKQVQYRLSNFEGNWSWVG